MNRELPSKVIRRYAVVGRNTASSSAGSIHDDRQASKFGFEGGLVPGVNVLSHMCHPILDTWGEAWLKEGSLDVILKRPAYHDRTIDMTARVPSTNDQADSCLIEAACGERVCATGTAKRRAEDHDDPTSRVVPYESAKMPTPENRPLMNGSELFVGMPLGSIKGTYTQQEGHRFMERMGEKHVPFTNGDYAHPGILLSYVIYSFVWTVATPVGIHAGCRLMFHDLLRTGMPYETRGRIAEIYRVGSKTFVEYEHVVLSRESIILSGCQKAVVQLD